MRRVWRKKTVLKALTFLLAVLFTASIAQSCDEKFIPFRDVPIANITSEYFMSMCENPERYQNMFIYLIVEHYSKTNNIGYRINFDETSAAFFECKRQFEEWKELYPPYAERMENTLNKLIAITNHIRYRNMEKYFNAMLQAVKDFVAVEFTQDAELTSKYESLVSEEFFQLCGADMIKKYCDENNLTVASVEYDAYPSAVVHHYYPFSFDYTVNILYTENGKEPVEKNIKKQPLKLRYFIGIDENENYIIEYVADVSGIEVVPAPPLPEDPEETSE